MFYNTQVLINHGKRILDRCNRLTNDHIEEQFNENHYLIGNEMKVLGEEIDKYNTQVASLKSKLKTFGEQTFEELKVAREKICCRNKAMISQGAYIVTSILMIMISFYVGGVVGNIICGGFVIFGVNSAKAFLQVYNAGIGVVKIKDELERKLNMTEEKHQELCEQYTKIKDSFANCEAIVPVQPNAS